MIRLDARQQKFRMKPRRMMAATMPWSGEGKMPTALARPTLLQLETGISPLPAHRVSKGRLCCQPGAVSEKLRRRCAHQYEKSLLHILYTKHGWPRKREAADRVASTVLLVNTSKYVSLAYRRSKRGPRRGRRWGRSLESCQSLPGRRHEPVLGPGPRRLRRRPGCTSRLDTIAPNVERQTKELPRRGVLIVRESKPRGG